MRRLVILSDTDAKVAAVSAVAQAPITPDRPLCVRIEPYQDVRSRQANALYWSRLEEIADQVMPGGVAYTPDAFHEYFARKFLPQTWMTLPNGKTALVRKSTKQLTVAEFGDYLERIAAWAAHHEVQLTE